MRRALIRAVFLLAAPIVMLTVPGGAAALGVLSETLNRTPVGRISASRTLGDDTWDQVRIEQHLIIRITPGNPEIMRDALPPPLAWPPDMRPPESRPPDNRPERRPERRRERKFAPCVPAAAIGGVRAISDTRLVLLLRDRRLIAADLARGCTARDFYMGFYLTPTGDGALCIDRDTIHSRAGASCTITRLREIVPGN